MGEALREHCACANVGVSRHSSSYWFRPVPTNVAERGGSSQCKTIPAQVTFMGDRAVKTARISMPWNSRSHVECNFHSATQTFQTGR